MQTLMRLAPRPRLLLESSQIGQDVVDLLVAADAPEAHLVARYHIAGGLESAQLSSVQVKPAADIAGEYLKSAVEPALRPITLLSCGPKPARAEGPTA
jgi:hypothetical protein